MPSSPSRIDALVQKRQMLDARIDRLKQREAASDRKARSRALLLLGVAVEKQIRQQPDSIESVRRLISQNLLPREQAAVLAFLSASTISRAATSP
ncbi:hypothetical protein FNZ56_04165 [Pseudoluteimonas lycopersici]|uniref:Mobilization protein n=1 Tax=Pseudoluteimonas lycopersici TaxID=1324796 RepID=A0A516V3M8_9GAMM|nr:hypothetical protein [Lysobacter lycopersici]QDQ73125.1 hypothetical protein FNZ56_04165 [Lysobacter lycopersici]